jgi:hypothetical protein
MAETRLSCLCGTRIICFLLWDMMLHTLAGRYQWFEGSCIFWAQEQHTYFCAEYGGSMFFWNVNCLKQSHVGYMFKSCQWLWHTVFVIVMSVPFSINSNILQLQLKDLATNTLDSVWQVWQIFTVVQNGFFRRLNILKQHTHILLHMTVSLNSSDWEIKVLIDFWGFLSVRNWELEDQDQVSNIKWIAGQQIVWAC